MLIFGKMSVGVFRIATGLRIRISKARTMKVYGRSRAIFTIHISLPRNATDLPISLAAVLQRLGSLFRLIELLCRLHATTSWHMGCLHGLGTSIAGAQGDEIASVLQQFSKEQGLAGR